MNYGNINDDRDYKPYLEAYKQGFLKESEIDTALIRLFTARMKLGMFDPPEMVPYTKIDEKGQLTPDSMKLAMASGALTGSLIIGYERRKSYDYLPGHKLGEKDVIVFWRKDKASGKIMAVFGDLTIREIKQDEVPAASAEAALAPPTPVRAEVAAPVKVAPAKVVAPPPVRDVAPPARKPQPPTEK